MDATAEIPTCSERALRILLSQETTDLLKCWDPLVNALGEKGRTPAVIRHLLSRLPSHEISYVDESFFGLPHQEHVDGEIEPLDQYIRNPCPHIVTSLILSRGAPPLNSATIDTLRGMIPEVVLALGRLPYEGRVPWACELLSRLSNHEAESCLLSLLGQTSRGVKSWALELIRCSGGRQWGKEINDRLMYELYLAGEARDAVLYVQVFEAISATGVRTLDTKASEQIERLLSDPVPKVRGMVMYVAANCRKRVVVHSHRRRISMCSFGLRLQKKSHRTHWDSPS